MANVITFRKWGKKKFLFVLKILPPLSPALKMTALLGLPNMLKTILQKNNRRHGTPSRLIHQYVSLKIQSFINLFLCALTILTRVFSPMFSCSQLKHFEYSKTPQTKTYFSEKQTGSVLIKEVLMTFSGCGVVARTLVIMTNT